MLNQLNLEPAKKFFTEAIQLTQIMGSSNDDITNVPVTQGHCIKMTLCDEYRGAKLQKFFARKGTAMEVVSDLSCTGFIAHKGDMVIIHDEGQVRMPEEKHLFYISEGKKVLLKFIEDTWFYKISIPS